MQQQEQQQQQRQQHISLGILSGVRRQVFAQLSVAQPGPARPVRVRVRFIRVSDTSHVKAVRFAASRNVQTEGPAQLLTGTPAHPRGKSAAMCVRTSAMRTEVPSSRTTTFI